MGRKLKFSLLAAVASLALVAAAGAGLRGDAAAGTTLVFAASADPVILDGPLVSDGDPERITFPRSKQDQLAPQYRAQANPY